MGYLSPYGKSQGLEKRLDAWAERLGRDKTLAFPGLGLIEDLRAAARELRGEKPAAPEYDL